MNIVITGCTNYSERKQRLLQCYQENQCNWTSWISSALGGTKPCNRCNSAFIHDTPEPACQEPTNKEVVGLWESTTTSRGGIGNNFEFKNDGSYTAATVVLVNLTYEIKDGKFYMSQNPGEQINYTKGAAIEVTETGFTLTGEDGTKEVKVKKVQNNEKTIIGEYKYHHYTGGTAYEKYTSDGEMKFRLPMKSVSGCYSINNGEISVTQNAKKPAKISYIISSGNLTLKSPEGEYLYSLVPEGTWYDSKDIDYQKSKN